MKRLGSFVAVAVIGMSVGAAGMAGFNYARGSSGHVSSGSSSASNITSVSQTSGSTTLTTVLSATGFADFSALYDAVRPTIVEIDTVGQGGRRFSQQTSGLGSGVVLDTEGHILTNYHVVRGSQTIAITFADGATASANTVGTDPADDLAVVQTDAAQSELHPATLGDSDTVKIGSVVEALGNPFGLEGSFSTGVVSGLDRTLGGSRGQSAQHGLLQTNAAVNEGSSGGGLFDATGRLIGITNAIENPDASTFVGVAYAVPINTARQVMHQVLGR